MQETPSIHLYHKLKAPNSLRLSPSKKDMVLLALLIKHISLMNIMLSPLIKLIHLTPLSFSKLLEDHLIKLLIIKINELIKLSIFLSTLYTLLLSSLSLGAYLSKYSSVKYIMMMNTLNSMKVLKISDLLIFLYITKIDCYY